MFSSGRKCLVKCTMTYSKHLYKSPQGININQAEIASLLEELMGSAFLLLNYLISVLTYSEECAPKKIKQLLFARSYCHWTKT